jgi:hypothetical protein
MSDGFWHQVQQGEWLTKIAHGYGFADWRTKIWDHPNNAALAKRRDPNVLYPGDRIFVPSPSKKEVECSTGQNHKFVLKTAKDDFFLRVLDSAEKPIAHQKWELTIGQQEFKGTTDENGELSVRKLLPSGDHAGHLFFPELGLAVPVQVGQLNPELTGSGDDSQYDGGASGIQMRLANLGYDPGNADGIHGPRTRSALMKFQLIEMGLSPERATGELDDDTRQAIVAKHLS